MTPWEVYIHIEAWRLDAEYQHTMLKSLAWRTAALQRGKRFPSMKEYLKSPPVAKKLTKAEREERAAEWAKKRAYWEGLVNGLAQEGKL